MQELVFFHKLEERKQTVISGAKEDLVVLDLDLYSYIEQVFYQHSAAGNFPIQNGNAINYRLSGMKIAVSNHGHFLNRFSFCMK